MRLQWRNVFTTLPRNHLVPFRPQVTFKMGYSYATRVLERPCLRAQKDNGDGELSDLSFTGCILMTMTQSLTHRKRICTVIPQKDGCETLGHLKWLLPGMITYWLQGKRDL